jgi:hypothetical protein
MTRTRQTALAFAAGRGAFGAGLVAAPAQLAAACDLSDIAVTYAAGDTLPGRARIGTVALARVSALAGAALIAAVDR